MIQQKKVRHLKYLSRWLWLFCYVKFFIYNWPISFSLLVLIHLWRKLYRRCNLFSFFASPSRQNVTQIQKVERWIDFSSNQLLANGLKVDFFLGVVFGLSDLLVGIDSASIAIQTTVEPGSALISKYRLRVEIEGMWNI